MSKQAKQFYEFGVFRVDALKRRLWRDGEVVPLTPKAFDTLLALIENSGRVVEKDELMERVWPGIAVEENNLTQNISALRKALGERREEPQYIATVPGLGYRFVASVTATAAESPVPDLAVVPLAAPPAESAPQAEVRPPAQTPDEPFVAPAINTEPPVAPKTRRVSRLQIVALAAVVIAVAAVVFYYPHTRDAKPTQTVGEVKSIAILPFRLMSSDTSDEYLGMGMADALITKLTNIQQIVVRPTSAVLKYSSSERDLSAAGRELEVDALLDGMVQKSGDRIKVTVQLVRASDGRPFWASEFHEKYTDIFTVEDQISQQVAESLLPTLTSPQKERLTRHQTDNTEAYEAYIKGRYYWNKRTIETLKKATTYFEDAILKDSNYALAYAGLADSYATLSVLDTKPAQDNMPKAQSAARRALEIDPDLGEAHASLAYIKHRFEWDWAGAEREFKRAIELNPGYATAHQWYGWYLLCSGAFDSALAEFKQAQQLDPLSLYVNLTLGMPYFQAHQYDKAIEQYKRVVEMDANFPLAHRWLAKAYEEKGLHAEALSEGEKFLTLSGSGPAEAPLLGYIYARMGKQAEARQMIEQLKNLTRQRYVPAYDFAIIYTGLGETDQAFESLRKAVEERDASLVFLKLEPQFDSIRSDPRFAVLLEDIGLPQ